ncbi:MAG: aminopeptidase P family N-terminal domain-containing protein, partial [Bacteroidia bacterium]|nr:aminopeptidase P family N-terminal domain-containing protein [Bacteroidia bacterium]
MNIELAQAWLKSQSLDAYFHYHTDPHQSEYLADHWQVMAWLTGFTGSAGTVVFTQNGAALWADSRYYLQAEKQLEGSGIALMKTGLPGTQATDEWLKEQLPEGGTVGIDPNLISITPYFTTKKSLQAQGFELTPVLGCVEAVWADRPPLSTSRVKEHDVLYAGQSREEKLTAVRAKMLKNKADVLLIPTLDDLAWLLNLRGSDIDFNPVFMSYLLIEADNATLFVDAAKVPQSIAKDLASAGVGIRPYNSVLDAIASIPEALSIWLDYGRSNYALYQAIPAGRNMVKSALPTILMKACK